MGIDGNHIVRFSCQRRFHGLFAHGVGFHLVNPGSVGNGGSAQQARLFCPGLDTQLLNDAVRYMLSGAAGDPMSEAVHNAGGGQRLAVQAADAF